MLSIKIYNYKNFLRFTKFIGSVSVQFNDYLLEIGV